VLPCGYQQLVRKHHDLALYGLLCCRAPRIGGEVQGLTVKSLAAGIHTSTKNVQTSLTGMQERGVVALPEGTSGTFTLLLLDPRDGRQRGADVKGDYFRIDPAVFGLGFKSGPLAAYLALRYRTDSKTQECIAGRPWISNQTGMSIDAISDATTLLEQRGVLSKHQRRIEELTAQEKDAAVALGAKLGISWQEAACRIPHTNKYVFQALGPQLQDEESDLLDACSFWGSEWRFSYEGALQKAVVGTHEPESDPRQRKNVERQVQYLITRFGLHGTLDWIRTHMDHASYVGMGTTEIDWLCYAKNRNELALQPKKPKSAAPSWAEFERTWGLGYVEAEDVSASLL
jgi:hypothetical protein